MRINNKKYILIVILFFIALVLFSLYFNLFNEKNNISINQLDENMCTYHYLSLLEENFSEDLTILEIEYKNKGLSIFPDLENIFCIGKVIDYEVSFYEEVDNFNYVKLNLYVFTSEKLINVIKILLIFLMIMLKKLPWINENFHKNMKVIFFLSILFLTNFIFNLNLRFINFFIESVFYTILLFFIDDKNKKFEIINEKHNISIDSLRAVAVLAVIFNHFGFKSISSGYLGVDLFFVISGYVITKKYINLEFNSIKNFYAEFIFFRLKRIIPNLIFFVSITSIFIYFLDYNYKDTLSVGLFSIFAISNIYLYQNSLDYFSTDSALNSFTHTWSLGIEEQFYIIFPFFMYALLTRKIKKHFILVLTFLSIILFYTNQIYNPGGTYYLIQYRFWQMAIGCLLVIYSHELKKLSNMIPVNFLIILVIGVFTIDISYSRNLTLISSLLFGLIILGVGNSVKKNKILESPKLASIGVLSYSLYLWHWPVISLSKWANFEYTSFEFQSLLMLGLSLISFKYIEQPFRNIQNEKRKKYLISLFSLTIMSGLFIFSITNFTNRNNILSGNNPYVFQEKEYKNIVNEIKCYHPSNIDNAFEACMVYIDKKINVYLIGDSHSTNHFLSLEDKFINDKSYNFNHLVEWGFIRDIQGIKGCAQSQKCIENSFSRHLDFYRDNLNDKDIVIFSFSRDWFKEDGVFPRKNIDSKVVNFEKNFSMLIQTIKNTGAKVVLIDDIPKTCDANTSFYNDIILKGNIESCTVSEEISKNDRIELTNLYLKFIDDNTIYLDPHNYFCSDSLCSIIDLQTNEILFSDLSPHISINGKRIMDIFWLDNFTKLINHHN